MIARRAAAPTRRWSVPPGGWSRSSRLSILSVDSALSVLAAGSILSLASAGSILSIGSTGSILSLGSAGSVLSVGSVGSVLSVGSAFSMNAVGGTFALPNRDRPPGGAEVHPLPPARALGLGLGSLALLAAVVAR